MCGRIALASAPHELAERFFLDEIPELMPRYNIGPGQDIPVVVPNPQTEGRLVRLLKWGLEPPWQQGRPVTTRLFNARGETVLEKPVFRESFLQRRCLVPVDGFFEWQKRPDGRQPFYFSAKDRKPMALAGIWETREYPGGHRVGSCSILTVAANSLMRPVHHRMPVILPEADWKFWLDLPREKTETLLSLLKPLPAELLQSWPVSREVNRSDCDDPHCVEPVWDNRGGQLNLFS